RHFNPDEVWNMPAARRLNRRQMGALREIAILREEIAQTKDVPPFKVMLDETMVILAESAPQHPRDLSKVRGVTRWISGRYAEDTIAAITRGLNSPPTRRPPPAAQDDALTQTRYNALREWR
ncbi:MAG TPA: HRDC domain-containing protein, partial [Aggregatilineales bacterium]|nr:HRDC domain-containing protein [Aggregatilineales bacterium]